MKELKHVISGAARLSVYVLLVLALIQPFGIDTIKEGRMLFIFGETFLSFLCMVIATFIADAVMGSPTYEESLRRCIVRILFFMAVACPLVGASLLTFNGWFSSGNLLMCWMSETGGISLLSFLTMTMYVACLSVIISIIAVYQYRNDCLRKRLEEVGRINELLEQRQERMEQEGEERAETDAPATVEAKPMVVFVGQGQNGTLTLSPSDLIYVESMANYADICYIADNEICHSTLRITLKQVRETLSEVSYVAQCHRAFLVNLNFVLKLTERGSGCQLQLFGMEKQIPVSRANTGIIKDKLTGVC